MKWKINKHNQPNDADFSFCQLSLLKMIKFMKIYYVEQALKQIIRCIHINWWKSMVFFSIQNTYGITLPKIVYYSIKS